MHGTQQWHSSGSPGRRRPTVPVAICRSSGIKFLSGLLALQLLAASSIHAATTFRLWDNGGGDGLWSNTANWSNNNVPNTATEVAEFGSLAPNAISQDVAALTVGELLFDSGGIARNITGSAITLSGISSSGIINNS